MSKWKQIAKAQAKYFSTINMDEANPITLKSISKLQLFSERTFDKFEAISDIKFVAQRSRHKKMQDDLVYVMVSSFF